jgi:hypothetical protein
LDTSDFTVALSLDFGWFTPDQAERLADVAATEGLLERDGDGDELSVTFDLASVEIPDEFEPDEQLLRQRSTFERLLSAIVDAGIEKQEAVGEINRLQADCELSLEAAAALYARREGVDAERIAPIVREEVID